MSAAQTDAVNAVEVLYAEGTSLVPVSMVADRLGRPKHGVSFTLGVAAKRGHIERIVRAGRTYYRPAASP